MIHSGYSEPLISACWLLAYFSLNLAQVFGNWRQTQIDFFLEKIGIYSMVIFVELRFHLSIRICCHLSKEEKFGLFNLLNVISFSWSEATCTVRNWGGPGWAYRVLTDYVEVCLKAQRKVIAAIECCRNNCEILQLNRYSWKHLIAITLLLAIIPLVLSAGNLPSKFLKCNFLSHIFLLYCVE